MTTPDQPTATDTAREGLRAAVEALLDECRCTLSYPGFDRTPFTNSANCPAHAPDYTGVKRRLRALLAAPPDAEASAGTEAVHAAADALVDYARETFWRRDSPFSRSSRHAYQSAAAWLHEHAEGIDSYKSPESVVHLFAPDGEHLSLCEEGAATTTTLADVTCGDCRVAAHVRAALHAEGSHEGGGGGE